MEVINVRYKWQKGREEQRIFHERIRGSLLEKRRVARNLDTIIGSYNGQPFFN